MHDDCLPTIQLLFLLVTQRDGESISQPGTAQIKEAQFLLFLWGQSFWPRTSSAGQARSPTQVTGTRDCQPSEAE